MTSESGADDARDAHDQLIVAALAGGSNYDEAAAIAGVSARTVRRRMADPGFAQRVSEERGERVAQVTGRLVDVSFEAVETLRTGLTSDKTADQLRAAHEILVLGLRYRTDHELEARPRALEQQQEETRNGTGAGE